MNWLDKAIGWVSPQKGFERTRLRAAMQAMRGYDGAKAGRRTSGWTTAGTSANAEIGPAANMLRERVRDLARNSPYIARGMDSLVANLIGSGISPATPDKAAKALWPQFVRQCDADGQLDFYGLQALVARTAKESGECLVRLRPRRPSDGLAVPLQLQVLEPDYLDSLKTGPVDAGFCIQGVEFNSLGQRAAYWLYPQHPGDVAQLGKGMTSKRIPADEIIHIYRKTRPGQVRGVPDMASVVLTMRDLDDYEEAELVRKKIEACFTAFVTSPEGQDATPLGQASTVNGQRVESFEPGMIEYLSSGQDVKFGNPSAAGGYGEYVRARLHAVAAGMGITYEMLTGDLSQVNFSSIRAGQGEFRRAAEQWQWQTFVPMFCEPVWQAFVRAAFMAGKLKKDQIPVEWSAPRWDYVNPLDDVKADKEAVAGGLMSLSEALRRRGYEPASVFAEMAEDVRMLDDLGVVVDTDPRHKLKSDPRPA